MYIGSTGVLLKESFEPNKDAWNNSKLQEDSTGIYFVDLPAGLDTIEFKATVILDPDKKVHRLKFPGNGTETNVFIFDSTYLKAIQANPLPNLKPLAKGDFAHNEGVLLDITLFQGGQYYVHYLSCELGGIFPLTIK